MRLLGRLTPVADIPAAQRDVMFALMEQHYENVRRELFEADLDEKQWVMDARSSHGRVVRLLDAAANRAVRRGGRCWHCSPVTL